MNKIFYIIKGKNKAIYILNILDLDTSLKFYKAKTKLQKIKKFLLKYYISIFDKSKLINTNEVSLFLNNIIKKNINFNIDDNCSILISPTRDKIIINHHNQYFHKFAFGQSYESVRNEAKIYKLLNSKSYENFYISKLYDYIDKKNYCSFKLSNNFKFFTSNDIILALVEFFNTTRKNNVSLNKYLEILEEKYKYLKLPFSDFWKNFYEFKQQYKNEYVSTGLVHRDFKHWNIDISDGLLIYDFEETVIDGLPLEDLFNYYIDPIIRYYPINKISNIILNEKHRNEYKRYLKLIDVKIDFKLLLKIYLFERILFWSRKNEINTAIKYYKFLNFLNEKRLL